MNTNKHLYKYLVEFFLEREKFRATVVEKIKTHISFSNFFFLLENRVLYEVMWTNIVQPGRPQMTIWFKRIACWIPKYLSFVNCNNGNANAPLCYSTRILPVLFTLALIQTNFRSDTN